MKECKVKDLFQEVKTENIRIRGKIGALMDVFFKERVVGDFAKNVIYKETENAFRNQIDDENGLYGIWQGEYWGKWIISAVRVSRYYHDEDLKSFIKQAAYNLMALQREDGYLGTYKKSDNVYPADPEAVNAVLGWPCNWNWNVWCRKYTLWGMIEAYLLIGDEKILNCAIGIASQLISEFKEKDIDIIKTGVFTGIASCSIMKPMLILYRITEDVQYLDFCLNIADKWEKEKPGLIMNSLADKDTLDWYDDPESWTKTYESLSCFDGLLELYRITGGSKYLEATEKFYDILERCEKNLLFSVGYNDNYRGAADEVNALTEPCDVIHYIRVCYELFKLTGNVRYLDSLELCYYNPMLASPCKDGKWAARAVHGAGAHMHAHDQAKMKHSHCCVNNIPRGLLNVAECSLMTKGSELYINMYHSYDATIDVDGKKVNVKVEGNYVADSYAKICIDCLVDFVLRIPAWTKTGKVIVNGKEYIAKTGFFSIKKCDIPPKKSGVEIEIAFDNNVHVYQFNKTVPKHTADQWQYRAWCCYRDGEAWEFDKHLERGFLNSSRCTLQKGVVLLSRSKLIGNTTEEMFDGENLIDDTYSCTLEKCETDADVQGMWLATFSKGEKCFTTKVCDFPFAANFEQDDLEYFSIYF